MDFLYDESGNAYSFVYNGTQYYYVRNLQGDVVKILNTSSGVVASYTYDAWGNRSLSKSNIAAMNGELAAGRWVIGDVFTNIGATGHSVVIQSYDATTEIYTFWDPWTDSNGTFTKNQLLNNTIHTVSNQNDRTLGWVQYCN